MAASMRSGKDLPFVHAEPGETDGCALDAASRDAALVLVLVEDEPDLREGMQDLLSSEGYRVLACGDGRTALGVIEGMTTAPDVVLTDLMMPVMSGWELVEAIRSRPALDATLVVVVSAVEFAEPVPRGVRVMRKPVGFEDLLRVVERSRAERAERLQ